MLLEFNLYDNFNPNLMERDYIPNIPAVEVKGYPKPKARGTILDYELWQTGFEYTSSGTLTTEAKVGDILEVLTTIDASFYLEENQVWDNKLSLWYVVTAVDDANKVTLKNYYWYHIEGSSNSSKRVPSSGEEAFRYMLKKETGAKQLMVWDIYTNRVASNLQLKYNIKDDTVDFEALSKSLFSKLQFEPQAISVDFPYPLNTRLMMCLVCNEWVRTTRKTRIDIAQSPSIETVVTTERSNYNYIRVFYKNEDGIVSSTSEDYTIDDNGNLIKMSTYTGTGYDLPEQRTVKTLYYEDTEKPTNAELLSEVRGDSIVHKIYFNQNKLNPLAVNNLVEIWYEGTMYKGHIADRCLTPLNDRLTFIEFGGM